MRKVPWDRLLRRCPDLRKGQRSGLVTQTLLVPILAHALAALMLVNFSLSPFLEGSHSV